MAREIALTLAASVVRPRIIEHTPGVANKLADALSRRYQPEVQWRLPAVISHIPEYMLAPRSANYYRSLAEI